MGDACILLIAQIFHILSKAGCLGMAFGVAGRMNIELRLIFPHKGSQITGVDKILALRASRRAVAAQCKDVAHTGLIEFIEQCGSLLFITAHAEHMGKRFNIQLILEKFGHLYGGDAAGTSACAISHADEIG